MRNISPPRLLQTEAQPYHSGSDLLFRGEKALSNYNEWIVKIVLKNLNGEKRHWRVLDYGAGIGTLSLVFERMTGIKPEGMEIDPKQRAVMEGRGFRTYSSLEEIEGKFDLIFTFNVLEHIENDTQALMNIKKKLNSDGTLVIYVPAFQHIWTTMDDKVGHYRRYEKKELIEKLKACRFEIINMHYCDSVGFLLSILFQIIGNKEGEPTATSLLIFDRCLLPISKVLDLVFRNKFGKNLFAAVKHGPS
jgi:SAM-dependent methyltransferase